MGSRDCIDIAAKIGFEIMRLSNAQKNVGIITLKLFENLSTIGEYGEYNLLNHAHSSDNGTIVKFRYLKEFFKKINDWDEKLKKIVLSKVGA